MNQGDDDLATDGDDGANPLAVLRVRRAMTMAIDREAIRQAAMRGQSQLQACPLVAQLGSGTKIAGTGVSSGAAGPCYCGIGSGSCATGSGEETGCVSASLPAWPVFRRFG